MIYSLSFERMDLFRIGKGPDGRRIYQTNTVSDDTFEKISQCVKAGLGL
jgi:hypothetical protein